MTRAVLILALLVFTGVVSAQAPGSTPSAPAFEVASIKPNTDGERAFYRVPDRGQVAITNGDLRRIIALAYRIDAGLQRYLMTGGPADLLSARFDITAKPPDDAAPRQQHAMLRTLLAGRFSLRARFGAESPQQSCCPPPSCSAAGDGPAARRGCLSSGTVRNFVSERGGWSSMGGQE